MGERSLVASLAKSISSWSRSSPFRANDTSKCFVPVLALRDGSCSSSTLCMMAWSASSIGAVSGVDDLVTASDSGAGDTEADNRQRGSDNAIVRGEALRIGSKTGV